MNVTQPTLILSAEGFTARPELTVYADSKVTKLRRHEHPRVGHVRVHVRLETPHGAPAFFAVTATAETRGPDLVAHASADAPEAAVKEAFAKLERGIVDAAGARKHERQNLTPAVGATVD